MHILVRYYDMCSIVHRLYHSNVFMYDSMLQWAAVVGRQGFLHVSAFILCGGAPLIFSWITKCDDKLVCFVVHTYSFQGNEISVESTQALGEGLQHCTNLRELKLVMCVLI